jgi:Uma2 family endonuclease
MSTAPQTYISPQQYLEIERQADHKSEYFAGEMFAMAGATREHNLLSTNLTRELSLQLKERECEVYSSDMRVKVELTGLYTYPDVTVACEHPQFEDGQLDTLLNPTVVIEILSDSTEAYDRGRKFAHYRKLDSLREYLLVAQDRCHIEHYVRQPDNQWLLSETDDPGGQVALPSIDCTLAMAEVYRKVRFEEGGRDKSGPSGNAVKNFESRNAAIF